MYCAFHCAWRRTLLYLSLPQALMLGPSLNRHNIKSLAVIFMTAITENYKHVPMFLKIRISGLETSEIGAQVGESEVKYYPRELQTVKEVMMNSCTYNSIRGGGAHLYPIRPPAI